MPLIISSHVRSYFMIYKLNSTALKITSWLFGSLLLFIFMQPYYSPDSSSAEPMLDIAERPVLRILFVGNSYTFFNNMPKTIETLAKYDPSAYFQVRTEMHVEAGATLSSLLVSPKLQTLLTKDKWDYVVLQPQSFWASTASNLYSNKKTLTIWTSVIKSINAQPVFFMTWARKPETGWYVSREYSFLKSHEYMHDRIKKYSEYLVKKHHMLMVPIGDYWFYSLKQYPDLELYSADGSHPSQLGSLVIALIFYKTLVDKTLDDINYWPNFVDRQEKKLIIDLTSTPFSKSRRDGLKH